LGGPEAHLQEVILDVERVGDAELLADIVARERVKLRRIGPELPLTFPPAMVMSVITTEPCSTWKMRSLKPLMVSMVTRPAA
jgi:hypothetical protein